MTTEPMTRVERQAKRDRMREELMATAAEKADWPNRSMKCRGEVAAYRRPIHAGEPDGCKNDGSTCLCECHDPAAEES